MPYRKVKKYIFMQKMSVRRSGDRLTVNALERKSYEISTFYRLRHGYGNAV